ncbi:MAG: carboxylesterase family protein [Hyphomonadaceae bacterium]
MRILTGCAAGLALLAAACVAGPAMEPGAPHVRVETGELAGTSSDGVNVFQNIPFAAPPVGALRWTPPQPAAAWAGVRDATAHGPSCPQTMRPDGSPNPGGAYGPIAEDCLQLNVFAPAGAKKAPVMVWIHGGSHRTGAGWIYDGTSFAQDGIVVVTINYRLGALGYLAHASLGERSGNYGLMDQIAALDWVKRNIAAFGGDTGNVTVFGESAGGWSTMAVLAAPSARGLYHKAIVESGGGWYPPTTEAGMQEQGAKILSAIDIGADASADELRAIPMEKLATLAGDYAPYADGVLMPETPSQAMARGRFPDVPLIIGWNSGEDTLMGPGPLPEATLKQIPPIARMVYPKEAAEGDETLARTIFTDSVFGAPARWVAAQASKGQPSWLYHFSYVAEARRDTVKRAGHASEIPYVFKMKLSMVGDIGPNDEPIADLMHACWASFAKNSRPVCGDEAWPGYAPDTDQLMEFGIDPGVRTGFKKNAFTAQETVGLPGLKLGE